MPKRKDGVTVKRVTPLTLEGDCGVVTKDVKVVAGLSGQRPECQNIMPNKFVEI